MLYIYDPINNFKRQTTYKLLAWETGLEIRSLRMRRKIGKTNCYLIDEKTTKEQLCKFMQKEIIKDEIWKTIKGRFQVSNYGRVRKGDTILMPFLKDKDIHPYVNIYGEDKRIYRLVVKNFLRQNKLGERIFFIDGNTYNVRASNMFWGTKKGTIEYGNTSKIIFKIDAKTNNIIEEYFNTIDAAESNFFQRQTISYYLKRGTITRDGFIWKEKPIFKEEFV